MKKTTVRPHEVFECAACGTELLGGAAMHEHGARTYCSPACAERGPAPQPERRDPDSVVPFHV